MTANAVLLRVAKQGLSASSTDEIIKLACAYWHENFMPDIVYAKHLSIEEQRVIGYLTEFFSTFNVVNKERTIRLVALANELKELVNPVFNNQNMDEIAAEWGMDENLNKFHKDILFYQTRHYKHKIE